MIITKVDSPIGLLTLASDGTAITGLWIEGQKYYPNLRDASHSSKAPPVFACARQWLSDYFNGQIPRATPPLSPKGSAFAQDVWRILLQIPYGEVTTYGDIAKEMARERGQITMSAQAVGGAVGHNPISLIIPCHRVVGANGSLTGYAAGLDIKKELLELERMNK
ncbi:MAG: methylated-DNA--[protein]-cysteine S-methyltransferase [Clostridiales bacterium]|nr:methylated-DNA--[protein]-cysteine S-methyltransferase [Clostridiales bacterium]